MNHFLNVYSLRSKDLMQSTKHTERKKEQFCALADQYELCNWPALLELMYQFDFLVEMIIGDSMINNAPLKLPLFGAMFGLALCVSVEKKFFPLG